MDNEVHTFVSEIKEDVKNIKNKLHDIDIIMTRNTLSLEDHMAQTRLLRDMVLPLHTEKLQRDAVAEYETKKEEEYQRKKTNLYDRLKIPGFVISLIVGIATFLKMLGKL